LGARPLLDTVVKKDNGIICTFKGKTLSAIWMDSAAVPEEAPGAVSPEPAAAVPAKARSQAVMIAAGTQGSVEEQNCRPAMPR